MTMQMWWGLCLVASAAVTGLGIQLSLAGEGPLASYPLVVGGILLLPAAAAVLERLLGESVVGARTGHTED
ncbi:hypothetical protein [Nocardioides sp. SYSU DS0663]|uniref:hypothetical protein n=1 Tax=Nocardioides sp. SYSU DS0663 TaxID=3416445 RepID=UPI003F4B85D5